jgi:hypothetical protein
MSRKLRANKYAVLSAADSATDPVSLETGVKQLDTIIYDIDIDATVNAGLEVEGTIDDESVASKSYSAIDFGTPINLVGSVETKHVVMIRDNPFTHIRLKVTNNGGTGNITAHVAGVSKGA